ncbi:hypothetical protein CDAR_510781 [Caerostris darwini]|uniref:Uncharacterized protein n=1 Tax=Caerostris darwini TaxID=1538125 RepID=A0AAV4TAQ2_9ARAC|nr:hypothetical protein CDAR_510781 [Caerostris darwini]
MNEVANESLDIQSWRLNRGLHSQSGRRVSGRRTLSPAGVTFGVPGRLASRPQREPLPSGPIKSRPPCFACLTQSLTISIFQCLNASPAKG